MKSKTQNQSRFFSPSNRLILVIIILNAVQLPAQSVDPLTGRLQMAIDLFGLSHGGISVPVSIGHHGSSMRVREGEGSCGIGWGLAAGGAVTRIVRGLPDDVLISGAKEGWLYNNHGYDVQQPIDLPNDDLSTSDYTDEFDMWDLLSRCAAKFDTEPDLFYISAPGVSAQFVLAPDGQPKLLQYQDISITVVRPNGNVITEFIVKTPSGLVYTFNAKEDVTRTSIASINPLTGLPVNVTYYVNQFKAYESAVRFTESWNLATISSLFSDAVATFTYTSGEDGFGVQEFSTGENKLFDLVDSRNTKLLSTIALGSSLINLTWNGSLLGMVSLTAGNESKAYRLVYYSAYSEEDSDPKVHRYFLRELRPEVNCVAFPSYDFNYQSLNYDNTGIDVPISTGDEQDLWGYFSDASQSNTSTAYFYPATSDAARFRFTNSGDGINVASVSRQTQPAGIPTSIFGALTEISTPTGGVTKVEYESNWYYDPTTSQSVPGAGVRVKKISTYAGEQAYGRSAADQPLSHAMVTEFRYLREGSSVTSGKLTYPPEYVFTDGETFISAKDHMGEPSEVLYSRVEELIPGKGKTVYEFNLPGMYPSVSDGDWNATKTYIARSSGIFAGYLKNGSYTYPYPPHTNYNFDRGSLASVKVYAEGGTAPIRIRTLTYSRNPSTPEIIYGIRHERIGDIIHFGRYKMLTGIGSVVTQETSSVASELSPTQMQTTTTAYSYGGTPVLLQQVTTTFPDGSQSRRKIKYARDYSITTPSGDAATAIKYFNDNGMKSQLIESINFLTPNAGTEYVIGANLAIFKKFEDKTLLHQTYTFPAVSGFTESVVMGSPQQFTFDSDYLLHGTIETYSNAGQPVDQIDDRKNRISFHYATNLPLGPIASFSNTKASQTVYEGFELSTNRGLIITGGVPIYSAGWTGNKALELSDSQTLSNTVEKNGNNIYRVSCWVTAAQASTVTFQARNSGTLVSGSTVALNYNPLPLNKWIYLEGIMNVTNANNTFTIEVVSNAPVTVDDLLAIPSNAIATLSTYSPLNGQTSITDDRGHSMKQTYDAKGRKVHTLDRKRNLVARYEYQSAKTPGLALMAGIDANVTSFKTGVTVTFSSDDNCLPGLSYSWKFHWITGAVEVSTASSFNYTFAKPGYYELSLTVTNQFGSAMHTKSICVELNPSDSPVLKVANVSGLFPAEPYAVKECFDTNIKTFSVTNVPVCSEPGSTVTYAWQRYEAASGSWIPLNNIQPGGDFDGPVIEFFVYGGEIIRCQINIQCGADVIPLCDGGLPNLREVSAAFTFVHAPGGCQ